MKEPRAREGEKTMRTTRILVAASALAALTVAAQAQQGPGMVPSSSKIGQSAASASDKIHEESKGVKANEKAYNSALKNMPDKPYDPWRGVR
jgi:cytochrome c556